MGARLAIFILAAVALAQPARADAQVTGTATYLMRMALPPQAVFEAQVEDVSKADAPAEVIGSVRIPNPGNPPITFAIDLDPQRIDQRHRYSVRAVITVDGRAILRTDRAYPVLTQGRGSTVELRLVAVPTTGPARRPDQAALGPLPASFTGDLPCADCEGIRCRLNLFPDGSFYLRMTYLGKGDGASSDDIGAWVLSSNRKILVLNGGREAPARFRIVDAGTLRKLDLEGRDITSNRNYSLTRSAAFERLEPKLAMRGLFRYLADAGIFTECLTGQRWPVAQEAGNATLEREYGKARKAPGEPVMVSLEGRVVQRPKMEGAGLQPTLAVDRFVSASPGESCAPRPATVPLEKTSWRLTRLGNAAITAADPKRELGLTFDAASKRVSGSGGCNRFTGGYERTGVDGVRFGNLAGTMMACIDGMETEAAYLKALDQVRTWNILGSLLEVYDEAGTLLARFEARPPTPAK